MGPWNVKSNISDAGSRLDLFLKQHFPQTSRSRLQDWIKQGRVRVDGVPGKAALVLKGNESIEVEPADLPPLDAKPEALPLEVLYQDDAVIAINKPAGMVVHSGAGVHSGTLVNALLHHFARLSTVGGEQRPGIVHRLDRYTSGVLLVARTDAAHQHLAGQFAGRRVEKVYLAMVQGVVKEDRGTIEKPISRDPKARVRMTARLARGRAAHSEYRVLQRGAAYTFLEVKIGTGRTHQIRVHLSSIGHPVVGDRLYGAQAVADLDRFFLHAHRITFVSPATGKAVTVMAALPLELERWRNAHL